MNSENCKIPSTPCFNRDILDKAEEITKDLHYTFVNKDNMIGNCYIPLSISDEELESIIDATTLSAEAILDSLDVLSKIREILTKVNEYKRDIFVLNAKISNFESIINNIKKCITI